jgi:hypothetical protein
VPPDHFHGQAAQLFVQSLRVQKRPPIVEKYFHRTPHRHSAGNGKTLARQIEKRSLSVLREQIARYQTAAKKKQADDETDPPLLQQSLQLKPAEIGPVRKIIVDRLFR